MAHDIHDGDFRLSDDSASFDLDRAHRWIGTESYWAAGIPLETFRRACANSLTVGCYAASGEMAGMARVVTDRATFGWLCDVYVDPAERGRGLGTWLAEAVRDHLDDLGVYRIMLATHDAHGVYAKVGFVPVTEPDRWMQFGRRDLS